ncbi:hypothetical protein ACFSQ3_09630 [Sphingobacterium corticis]|uniref:Uncharacterized protein n=1 Tax=Sphingobacterium corticis TaxID=1812823 RepID=A0ABW5NN09_9SPHI
MKKLAFSAISLIVALISLSKVAAQNTSITEGILTTPYAEYNVLINPKHSFITLYDTGAAKVENDLTNPSPQAEYISRAFIHLDYQNLTNIKRKYLPNQRDELNLTFSVKKNGELIGIGFHIPKVCGLSINQFKALEKDLRQNIKFTAEPHKIRSFYHEVHGYTWIGVAVF